jgi:hypothetical protein
MTNCSADALKEYYFGEVDRAVRDATEAHLSECGGCRAELERLRTTRASLAALREEELPRRIAFVSDKVFEPSWWQRIWTWGPQLGFVQAAALIAISLGGYAWLRPASGPMINTAAMEARIAAEVERRLDAAVTRAVNEVESRQGARIVEAVAAAEKRMEFERRAEQAMVEKNFEYMQKQLNRMYLASAEVGSGR